MLDRLERKAERRTRHPKHRRASGLMLPRFSFTCALKLGYLGFTGSRIGSLLRQPTNPPVSPSKFFGRSLKLTRTQILHLEKKANCAFLGARTQRSSASGGLSGAASRDARHRVPCEPCSSAALVPFLAQHSDHLVLDKKETTSSVNMFCSCC